VPTVLALVKGFFLSCLLGAILRGPSRKVEGGKNRVLSKGLKAPSYIGLFRGGARRLGGGLS